MCVCARVCVGGCTCVCWRGERGRGRYVGDKGYSFVPRPSLPLVHVMGWPGNEGREGDSLLFIRIIIILFIILHNS